MKNLLKKHIPLSLQVRGRTMLERLGRAFQKNPKGMRILSIPDRQIFFGYYDVTPFSQDGRFVLAAMAPLDNVSPHRDHPELQIGFFDLSHTKPRFQSIGATRTWNWQQGCRLQWYPQNKAGSAVIYNTVIDGRYGAIIQNLKNGTPTTFLCEPVYTVSTNGAQALSLNFNSLHRYRAGYGYNTCPAHNDHDDILLIDIASNTARRILSLEAARACDPQPSMAKAAHYFNHLSFSPSGTTFMVTHLWVTPENKRRSRLIIADISGRIMACPNGSGTTSHYAWLSDNDILIFATNKDGSQGYYQFDLARGTKRMIGSAYLKEDGHPSFLSSQSILTDTYPDLVRHQKVILYDDARHRAYCLARFHSPISFTGETRCDLHPRLSPDHSQACVDIVSNGKRAMAVFSLPPLKKV